MFNEAVYGKEKLQPQQHLLVQPQLGAGGGAAAQQRAPQAPHAQHGPPAVPLHPEQVVPQVRLGACSCVLLVDLVAGRYLQTCWPPALPVPWLCILWLLPSHRPAVNRASHVHPTCVPGPRCSSRRRRWPCCAR